MADDAKESSKKLKKKGLPPISPRNSDGENQPKPIKKKTKKKPLNENVPQEESSAQSTQGKDKPTARRRRKRSPSQAKGDDTENKLAPDAAAPRKKKKKPKSQTAGDDENQNANENKEKEGQGSKTSLISKEGDGTPRKKAARKKKKVKKETDEDYFGESPWAEDLKAMTDDIVTGDTQREEEENEEKREGDREGFEKGDEVKKGPLSFITAPVLRSQPLDRIFIETSSKFKGQSKSVMVRQRQQEEEENARQIARTEEIVPRATTIDFAISSHSIFRVVSLFLHGLTAGLLLWHMVMIFLLSSSLFTDDDFLDHYYRVSLPLQASIYFLLALGTVSACDRFDVGNPTRRFILRAVTLQNGSISIVFSIIALVINLVMIKYDDKMYLYKEIPDLYEDPSEKADDIDTYRSLTAARSVLVVLCWLVLSITPTCDRLGKNLRSGETGLEVHLELDKVSAA